MSAELERDLRVVLRDPPVPEGLHDRLRDGVLAGFAGPRPGRRRMFGRGLRIAGAIAAATAVVAVIGLLVVATPSDPPASSTGPTGVEYVLKLTPTERGADATGVAQDAAASLRARGRLLGVTGLRVAAAGDRVTVFVPRTHDVTWAPSMLLSGLNMAVYDNATSLVASDASLPALLASDAVTSDSGPFHYYAALPSVEGGPGLLDGPYGSRAEATRRAEEFSANLGGRANAVRVPADISLVLNDDHAPGATPSRPHFSALRDPVVRPSDIETVSSSGATVTIVVAPRARAEVADRVFLLSSRRAQTLTFMSGASLWPGFTFRDYDAATGELRFTGPNAQTADGARTYSGGGVDAVVEIESARPVGPAPPRRGVGVTSVPAPLPALVSPGQEPVQGSALRVLRVDDRGVSRSLYTWVGRDGREIVGVKTSSGDDGASACPVVPNLPIIQPCFGGGTSTHVRQIVGRVGEGVVAVRAVYAGGAAVDARVADGWFLMILPKAGTPRRIDALSSSGTRLGSLDPARSGGPGAIFGTR